MQDSLLNEYIALIEEDKGRSGSYSRYPVRFIILPFSMIGAELVKNRLITGRTEVLELSSLLKKSDGWISTYMLLDEIKLLDKGKDFIVTGFSELVRFYRKSEFESLLISLVTDIENACDDKSRRIYFLCYGLLDHINQLLDKKYNRLKVFNPIIFPCNIKELEYAKLYFTDNNSISELIDIHLSTVKDWLDIWKRINLIKYPLICNSKTLNYWYNNAKPDNVFLIEKLDNEEDILSKIFDFNLSVSYLDKDKPYWEQLLKDVYRHRCKKLIQLVEIVFNINNAFSADFIKLWFESKNEYNKWLLILFFKEYRKEIPMSEYLSIILYDLKSYENDEFARSIWMGVFEHNRLDLASQRKELVSLVNKYYNLEIFENDFIQAFESVDDIEIKKELLTCSTLFEKKMVVKYFKENIITLNELAKIYPEFAAYISRDSKAEVCTEIEWINQYFYHYKYAKVLDSYTEEFKSLIEEMNGDSNKFYKWYYCNKLEFVSDIIKREKVDRIIILDGVGAEYLTLLTYIIKKNGWFIDRALYAKCKLPSITRYNNCDCNNVDKLIIPDFDKDVTHDEYYKSPESIIKAIDKIIEIFDTYIHVKSGERIAITADHGCTAIHRLVMGSKVYDYQDAEHDGRCLLTKDASISENEHYVVYKNTESNERWVIALRDVSLCKRSAYEVHGGATPEEIIVPFIIATKNSTVNVDYKVKSVKLKVSGLDRKISFEITPKPHKHPMLYDEFGNVYELNDNNGVWEVELKEVCKQKVTVSIDNRTYSFDIISTMEEDDLFD